MSNNRQYAIPDEHGNDKDLSRQVIAVAHDRPVGFQATPHKHFRAQLVFASDGVMRVSTDSATWIVPPQQAVWVPAGVTHSVINESAVAFRTLYLHPRVAAELPSSCCVLSVTPLLRELILYLVALPNDSGCELSKKLMAVIPELLNTLKSEPLQLPLPEDRRLQIITNHLMSDPSDNRSLKEWSELAGASQSTIERLFNRELGMGFLNWRQGLRLLSAIYMLSDDVPVTTIAYELGYTSTSAFIAMFRKRLGQPPRQYMQSHKMGSRHYTQSHQAD